MPWEEIKNLLVKIIYDLKEDKIADKFNLELKKKSQKNARNTSKIDDGIININKKVGNMEEKFSKEIVILKIK